MATAGDYEVLTLIAGCLVTVGMDIWPGLGIWPVDDQRHRIGIATVMDEILASSGWRVRVGTSEWLQRDSANLPLALVQHVVPAASAREATIHSRVMVDLVIGALALRRGAAAAPLVTVMRRRGGNAGEPEFVVESRARPYSGNLLGGSISGESPDDFARLLTSVTDPLVRLWLGARRDIAAERNLEFAVHRWWNMIEALAISRQPTQEVVVAFDGTPIPYPGRGKPFKTGVKPGLVFMHIRDSFVERRISETSFVGHSDNLWDFVVAWYGFRNAVAHHGTFDPTNQDQQRGWWFAETARAHEWETQRPGRYLHEVNQLGDLLIEWEIQRRSGTRPPSGTSA